MTDGSTITPGRPRTERLQTAGLRQSCKPPLQCTARKTNLQRTVDSSHGNTIRKSADRLYDDIQLSCRNLFWHDL